MHHLRSRRHGDGNHRRLHRFWRDVSSNLLQLQNPAEKTSDEQVGECSTDGNKNIEKKVTQKEEKIISAQQCACIKSEKVTNLRSGHVYLGVCYLKWTVVFSKILLLLFPLVETHNSCSLYYC